MTAIDRSFRGERTLSSTTADRAASSFDAPGAALLHDRLLRGSLLHALTMKEGTPMATADEGRAPSHDVVVSAPPAAAAAWEYSTSLLLHTEDQLVTATLRRLECEAHVTALKQRKQLELDRMVSRLNRRIPASAHRRFMSSTGDAWAR